MADSSYLIDGKEILAKGNAKVEWIDSNYFKLFFLGQKFQGEVVKANLEDKKLTIKINQRTFEVSKKGAIDELIKKMGLDKKKVKQLKTLQSPMPGRILSFAVKIGDTVEDGTALFTLEAMKMENVIKSDGVGIVKALVHTDDSVVEKGEVIIEFE